MDARYTPLRTERPGGMHPDSDYPFGVVELDEPPSPVSAPARPRSRSRSPRRTPRRQNSHTGASGGGGGGRAGATHSRSSSVSSHVRVGSVSHSRPSSRPSSRPPSRPPSRTSSRPPSRAGQHRSTPSLGAILARATGSSSSGHHHHLPAPVSAPAHKPGMGWRMWRLIKPWLPLLAYGATSLGFLLAVALWKTQVFTGLDHLSQFLQRDGWAGYLVLYSLIFITTIPPVPLYSTLIVLSGYTFGAFRGLAVSYCAALSGALAVFLVSRFFFKESISRWFAQFVYLKRVVRAIEKRPKLLFLIRVAPYPYNVMNCLLAASPTLTLRTYTICTALSLFKLIIHTTVGSTIHSFSRHYLKDKATDGSGDNNNHDDDDDEKSPLMTISTVVGIVLCVAIFLYLSYVARKAVDDELGDDDESEAGGRGTDSEERLAFLASAAAEEDREGEIQMGESPFRSASFGAAAAPSVASSPMRGTFGASPTAANGGELGRPMRGEVV